MPPPRASLQSPFLVFSASRALGQPARRSCAYRTASSSSRSSRGGRIPGLVLVGIGSGALAWNYPTIKTFISGENKPTGVSKLPPTPKATVTILQEDDREHDSSSVEYYQRQVSDSRKKPGLYVWGFNQGGVVAPDQPDDKIIKRPRRIPFFDGMLLRDVKLQDRFGAAVTENGDLVQWGKSYSNEATPEVTLKGKDITKINVSADRIIALSSGGSVYSLPVSKKDQVKGGSVDDTSWVFWTVKTDRAARILKPSLGYMEKVVDISSGLTHCLLLTSSGRVFSAASSSSDFPAKGQMGIPGLTWENRPAGPFDQPYEIKIPGAKKIKQIAAGDAHSITLDKSGDVYSFGDNRFGQLGMEVNKNRSLVDSATKVPGISRVSSIAAGGSNTFFTITSENTAKKPTAEIWASGSGLSGSLGTGNRPHVAGNPLLVKKLAEMTEWNEAKGGMMNIKPGRLSVGATHSAVVLQSGDQAWPVYLWGSNEFFELGTGKRRNMEEPTQMLPLDGEGKGGFFQYHFAAAPKAKALVGEGKQSRKVNAEQRVECGRNVTGVYMGV